MSESRFEYIEKGKKTLQFKIARGVAKLLYHRAKFRYLGKEFNDGPFLFIVNHCASHTPTRIENYFPRDFYMWGTHEMTEGIKAVRHYLVHTYYHQKLGLPMFFAQIVGTLFCPFANGFYRGMRLIPTYKDNRFLITIKNSIEAVKMGKPIVIYPEDSSKGYKDYIEVFFNGYLTLCHILYKNNIDLPIYVAHFHKQHKEFIIDEPILYSELMKKFDNDVDKASDSLRMRMNELRNL